MSNSRPVSINLYDMTNAAVSSGTVQYIFRGAIEGNFVHPAGTTSVTVTSGTATTTLLTSAIGNAFPYDLVVMDGLDYSFLLPYGDGGTVNVATLITSTNNPPAQNLYEPQLGSPGTSGHVLSSTTGGARSWVAVETSGAAATVQTNLNTHTALSTTAHGGLVPQDAAILSKSGAYPLAAGDEAKIIECNGTFTITLPNGLDTGFQAVIVNIGSGVITLAATTTLTTKDSAVTLANQYGAATVYHAGSNVWRAFGDLS